MVKAYIGTSGFSYSHWLGNFYPPNLKPTAMFSYYVQHFNTVEINSSFYHTPRASIVANWKKIAPKDFIFSFKMSRFITHVKKLAPETKSLKIFFDSLEPLSKTKNKQLVLVQTSAALKADRQRLESFIKMLPKTFLYAFEFRHPSWFTEEIYEILRKNNIALVLSDSPIKKETLDAGNWKIDLEARNLRLENQASSLYPQNPASSFYYLSSSIRLWPYENIDTADFFYIRFHGSKRLFSSSYTDDELKYYAKLIKEKLKKGLNVFAYFNNDAEGAAVKNAQRLKELLAF